MRPLESFAERLGALINNLEPPAQKEMVRAIAKRLRASQQQNIKRQQAPDGTPFKPRRAEPVRKKKGRVKREMFVKLRTAKYMKAKATNSEASVEFVGKVQRMARVHHYGLRDRPARGAKEVPYDERPLLGLDNNLIDDIHEIVTTFLEVK
jgi:phage virion morphogenesis protein